MKTPPKVATAATARTVPTMALDSPISMLLEELDVEVDEAEDVVDVEVVEDEVVLVAVVDEVADVEADEDVLLEVSVEEDEVDVAEVLVVLSSLVVVLSARLLLLLRAWNLRRSSPSLSGCVSSPNVDAVWHFSVIHNAFSASSSVQPAASKHVARSSTSTVSIAIQRVIIELSAHDRSDTMFARHALPISLEGAAVVGVVRSKAMATWARLSRILKKPIV